MLIKADKTYKLNLLFTWKPCAAKKSFTTQWYCPLRTLLVSLYFALTQFWICWLKFRLKFQNLDEKSFKVLDHQREVNQIWHPVVHLKDMNHFNRSHVSTLLTYKGDEANCKDYLRMNTGPFTCLNYRVLIKYCVFPWNVVIFLNFSRAEALVFYLPGVYTHTDTEGKQRKARVRDI